MNLKCFFGLILSCVTFEASAYSLKEFHIEKNIAAIKGEFAKLIVYFQGEPVRLSVKTRNFLIDHWNQAATLLLLGLCCCILYKLQRGHCFDKKKEEACRVAFELPVEDYKNLKDMATIYDMKERDLLLAALRDFFQRTFQ